MDGPVLAIRYALEAHRAISEVRRSGGPGHPDRSTHRIEAVQKDRV